MSSSDWYKLMMEEVKHNKSLKKKLDRLKAKRAALKKIKSKPFLKFEDIIPGLKKNED